MLVLVLFLLAVAAPALAQNADKRTVSAPLTAGLLGGGKVRVKSTLPTATVLLETGNGEDSNVGGNDHGEEDRIRVPATLLAEVYQGELPAQYWFLGNSSYARCHRSSYGQGSYCNTCWAFATQMMSQARMCKWRADAGDPSALFWLSPLNLICNVQRREGSLCEPKFIEDALSYASTTGILTEDWVREWKGNYQRSASTRSRIFLMGQAHTYSDTANPSESFCDKVLSDPSLPDGLVRSKPMASAAPYSANILKRYVYKGGPVVVVVRLSWEFFTFTGTLFNPSGPQTFCRMSRLTDKNDYCSPARRAEWDSEQAMQQRRPAGLSQEDWEETWYNHFVTLHGWGVTQAGVKYFVIENSWSLVYRNDPSLDNNGAGSYYVKNLKGANHFLLVAESVAGAGGLEITTRGAYLIRK